MSGTRRGRRAPVAAALAVALLAALAVTADAPPDAPLGPWNIILVVTDDQPADSWTTPPVGMPWLQTRLADPSSGWTWFRNAVVSTPMCCPSRASILTGRPSWQTGVTDNETGTRLDESETIATWLHARGYRTAMIGKYLNGYPWDRGPYAPPGWDRWLAKTNDAAETTYRGFGLVDQGAWRRVGTGPEDYVTTVLEGAARSFLAETPADRPWFLYLATPAPHAPYLPAPGDAGTLMAGPPPPAALADDVHGKPAWLRARPPFDAERLAQLQRERLAQRETLRSVDRMLAALWSEVEARGEAERTVIIVTSDNGFTFGEHRWVGKRVPYESSIRVPLAVYRPGGPGGVVDTVVSNLDLAPTIASIAGVDPPWSLPGSDLLAPLDPGRVVQLGWDGDDDVPAWRAVRTTDTVVIRWADGTLEAYDLIGDPDQSGEPPPPAAAVTRLTGLLDADPDMRPG